MIEQPDLFSFKPPERALARAADPRTSFAAAAAVTKHLPDLEATVLKSVAAAGRVGRNLDEVCADTGLDKVTASPRFKPLEGKGFILRAAFTRAGRAGKQQTVWIAIGGPSA